jgi:putative hemolysin
MSPVILEITVLLFLILANGLLAMSEIALVSARKARLKQWADGGDRGAQRALTLVSDPSRFFATVQIGITLVGILAGAVGGATLAANLGGWLATFPALAPYAQALGMMAVVAVITYFTLVLGELVPKRVALIHAERLAARVAPAMQALARIAAPVVGLLDVSTEGVLFLLGLRNAQAAPVTDEEIALLLHSGAEAGVFEPIEEEIVRHLFRLSDQRVSALITPRTEIVWLDPDEPADEIRRKIMDSGHSRYPVARGDLDNAIGQVLVKDLMAQEWQGLRIEVLDMDGQRVDKVLATVVETCGEA